MPRKLDPSYIAHAAELYTSGKSFQEVAAELGHDPESLRLALRRRGVIARPKTGRPAHNRLSPPDDLAEVYKSGESILAMSTRYGVSRTAVTRWVKESGLELRGRSEAGRLRHERMTPEQRRQQAAAAHAAIRRTERSDAWQEAIALGRERNQYGGRTSSGTDYLCARLEESGIKFVREKAVGRYNLDIALPMAGVAVEVLGGNWHGAKPIHARRTPYILNQGWHIVFVWNTKRVKIGAGAFDYLISFSDEVRFNPPAISQYRVIRGDGKLAAAGRADDDEFPLVPPSEAKLD